jgi:plastocyanin
MTPLRRLAALACLVLVVAGCESADEADRVPGPDDGEQLEFDVDATVEVDEDGFDPARLEVTVGDTIEVVNAGDHDHGLSSDGYDTGTLEPGERTVVFFDRSGTVEAHDPADPDNALTIVVAPRREPA